MGKRVQKAFTELDIFLVTLPVLTFPEEGTPIYLYLSITDQTTNFVLVQEKEKIEQPIYFVSNVFKGGETRYHKIKTLSLVVGGLNNG